MGVVYLKIKLITIVISVLLVTSSFSISSIDAFVTSYVGDRNEIYKEKNYKANVDSEISSHRSKVIFVSLTEKVDVSDDKIPTKDQFVSSEKVSTHTMLDVVDKLVITENDIKQQIFFSPIHQFQSTMDRILNSASTRSDKRKPNPLVDSSILPLLISDINNDLSSTEKIRVLNYLEFYKSLDTWFYDSLDSFTETLYQDFVGHENLLLDDFFVLENSLTGFDKLFNEVFDVRDTSFILIFFLVAGFVIIRSDKEYKQFTKIKPILSFTLIIILISSAIFTPFSISHSYWGMAFAEESSADLPTEPVESSADLPTEPVESSADLPTEPVESSADLPPQYEQPVEIPTNSTLIPTNATQYEQPVEIPTNSTLIPTNATQYEQPVEIPTNSTLIPTNSTQIDGQIVIPNATKSWQFNDLDVEEIILVGNATIQEGQGFNETSLQLDGYSDYAEIKDNSTRDLTELSLSAWIKPDYSDGSPEFTVISKSEAFSLSINNILAPEKIAKFAVFNGIKWTTVESQVKIMDKNWTYLTATFNGTTIAIYVNGTLQSTQKIDGLPFISVNGMIETKTINEITSGSDIVIGAYVSDLRHEDSKILSKFSGLIDDVRLYENLLDNEQILELYQIGKADLDDVVSTIPTEFDISKFDINKPVVELNKINFTSIVSAANENQSNSTAIENNEILVSLTGLEKLKEFIAVKEELLNQDLDQLTISAWIMPNYTVTGSTEYTVIAKEKSFILSLNNIIPPEKVGVFSVFDGISWSTITGETKIPEHQWSHLAAVIDKKDIRLYINGELEGSSSLYQPYLVTYNETYISNEQVAGTDAKIMVGVYYDTARGIDSISKRFTGSIDDIQIYKQVLTSDEIKNIVSARMLTLIPTNATLIPTNATLTQDLIESLSVTDIVTFFQTDTTLTNGTLSNNIDLQHDFIELDKPVTWTHEVILSNNTDAIAIQLPDDAKIIEVTAVDTNSTEKTIYKSDKLDNLSEKGIRGNKDAKEQNVGKIQIMNETEFDENKNSVYHKKEKTDDGSDTNTTDSFSSTIELESENIPFASLEEQLPEMVQENKETKLLVINETAREYKITFETPAPYKKEEVHSTSNLFNKTITVAHNSTLHYTDVKSYTDLPEDLVKRGVEFNLYWMINDTKTDVTGDPRFQVEFVDTNFNQIPDQMQWIVPQLSEQQFQVEAKIIIINVQSYPVLGGEWKVRFTTNGTADLTITAIDQTTFGQSTPDDLKFLELNNGTHTLTPVINGNTITYYNYSSAQEGFERSLVLTTGKHDLMFKFGNDVAYAHNDADSQNMLVYGQERPDNSIPQYKTHTITSGFGAAASAGDVTGTIEWSKVVATPDSTSNEKILCTDDSADDIKCQVWNGASWGSITTMSTNGFTTTATRDWDVTYINNTHAIVCYQDTVSSANIPLCRIWNTSTQLWGTAFSGVTIAGTIGSIRLIDDPNSNWVALMAKSTASSNDVYGQFYNPNSNKITNSLNLELTDGTCTFCFTYDGAWESSSGEFLAVFYDTGATPDSLQMYNFSKSTGWNPSTADSDAGQAPIVGTSNIMGDNVNALVELESDPTPTSNKILLVFHGGSNVGTRTWNGKGWDGSALGTDLDGSNAIGLTGTDLRMNVKYEQNGDQAIAVYADNTNENFYNIFTVSTGAWGSATALPAHANATSFVQLDAAPGIDDIMLTVIGNSTVTADVDTLRWSGTAWDAGYTNHEIRAREDGQSAWFAFGAHLPTSFTSNLSDSLSFTDTIATQSVLSKDLSESLSFTDTIATEQTLTKDLSESLSFTDTVATQSVLSKDLTDSLSFTDTVATEQTLTKDLTESLSFTDTVATQSTLSQDLSESLSFTDTVATQVTLTKDLSESLSFADTIVVATQSTLSKDLSDSLSFTDTVATGLAQTKDLSESLSFADTVSVFKDLTRDLTESIVFTDTNSFKGSMVIKTIKSTFEPGATYLIKPNPLTGVGTLTVVDGDASDNDSTNNGIIKISPTIFGTYNVTQTVTPSGTTSLLRYTFTTVHFTKLNATATFNVLDTSSTTLKQLTQTQLDAPHLNSTTLNSWQNTFNAVILSGTSQNTITGTSNLLPFIVIGNETNNLSAAIESQSSIKLATSIARGTSGSNIINTFGMPTYALPSSSSLDVVLPAIVTDEVSTHQVIATPPFTNVVPGQRMIVPIESSAIPSFGGVSMLDVESKSTASSTGTASQDWFVMEVDDEVPNSVPSLSSIELFIDVKYSYEENGVGFNWGNENNYGQSPTMTVLIPVPTSGVNTLSNGCADVKILTLVGDSWTSGIDTVLSNVPSSKSGFCDVKFESAHFSSKAVQSSPSGTTSSSGGGSSTISEEGHVDSKDGFGGILSTGLTIHEVSYDMCDKNKIQIIVSSDDHTPPIVKIKKSNSEIISAELAAEQPFAEQYESSSVGVYVYEATLKRSEQQFTVIVLKTEDATLSTQSTIHVTLCRDTVTVAPLPTPKEEEVNQSAPMIFDFKIKAGDYKFVRVADVIDEFVDINKTMTVSAIIHSPTQFRAELRFITVGEPVSKYTSIEMVPEPLIAFNNTFIVKATIPSELLQEPAISYWIHVVNEDSLVANSEKHKIGIKPDRLIDAVLELDSFQNLSGGSSYRPFAYVTNPSDVPVYGKVSLLANGQPVYTSPGQLFSPGESIVKLEWITPKTNNLASHNISAKLHLYDKSFETKQLTLYTFPKRQTVTLSELDTINMITAKKGNIVAVPSLLSSSLGEKGLDFRVVAPDGTCVIGSLEQCLVSESTFGLPGGVKSIVLENQVYRVRYSGADNVLERFSITSVDPIVGKWTIEHESKESLIPQAHAMQDGTVKITNDAKKTPLITVSSFENAKSEFIKGNNFRLR